MFVKSFLPPPKNNLLYKSILCNILHNDLFHLKIGRPRMAQIKSLDRIVKKWQSVTPQRTAEYQDGIQNPRADWQQQTVNATANYEKGIQASIANKSFAKGVAKRGTAGWQQKTLAKGPIRWAQGVQVSASDYQEGFAKYHAVLSSLTLPPRGAKGDPANIQRVAAVANALHNAKVKG